MVCLTRHELSHEACIPAVQLHGQLFQPLLDGLFGPGGPSHQSKIVCNLLDPHKLQAMHQFLQWIFHMIGLRGWGVMTIC